MIGKITTGKGAGGTIAYVTQKDGAQILSSTWIGAAEGWAAQAHEHAAALNPELANHGQSVVHISLSADPADGRLSDDQWRGIAVEYLERMGWSGHDHAVVRHTDTSHDHIHIILSRVGRDGQTADLHQDYPRQERVLDGIERDFGLTRTHEQLRLEAEKNPFQAVESVTRSALTFDRAGVERYFERMGFEPEKIQQLTDRALSDERVLQAGDRFTTQEVRAEVQQLDSALRDLAGQEARPLLDRGPDAREGLDAGQRQAADEIAAGRGLTVIEGFAGAGKSTMLRQAAEDLRFSGYDVIGAAPSGKAAKGLQDSAGIDSNTIAKTLIDIERGDLKLTHDMVLVVDEAGMSRNGDLGRLAQHVADAGGRLVLVGDERQLGAVGRGGGFAEAREIAAGGTARLDEIHRQRDGWQREASKAFGEGRAREAIQSYLDHGRVEWAASRGTARDMLVSDYARELDRGTSPDRMLALAHENRDVRAINAGIRDAIKERGGLQDARTYSLTGEDGKTHKIELAAGDRVVFERNDARSGVKNGSFGTVESADRYGFTVKMDGEKGWRVRVEQGDRQQMSHGYTSSIHKSQGATVDKTFVLASRGMDSKTAYVAMSRQREDVKMYSNRAEFKTDSHLKSSLARDGGREAFRSVRDAGQGQEKGKEKESAADRAANRGHGSGREAGGKEQTHIAERERQPVTSYITAAAMDQGKVETGLEKARGPEKGQEKTHEREAGKERTGDKDRQAGKDSRGGGRGAGKDGSRDRGGFGL
jgi:Ti-type conjugative transfer relaxase TraA